VVVVVSVVVVVVVVVEVVVVVGSVVVVVVVVVVTVVDVVEAVDESVERDVVVTDVDVVSEEETMELVVVVERNQSQAVNAPAAKKNKPINKAFFRNSCIFASPFWRESYSLYHKGRMMPLILNREWELLHRTRGQIVLIML
jgi:hypothetical protein